MIIEENVREEENLVIDINHLSATAYKLNEMIKNEDLEGAQNLIKEIGINQQDDLGNNLLHIAAKNCQYDLFKFLVDAGAFETKDLINKQNTSKNTPLHIILQGENELAIDDIIKYLNKNAIKISDVLCMQNKEGNTLLHLAVKKNYIDVAEILIKKGAIFDIENYVGKRPLDYLALGQEISLKRLIEARIESSKLKSSNQSTSTSELLSGHSRAQQNAPSTSFSEASVINESNSRGIQREWSY